MDLMIENMICWAERMLGKKEYAGWCLSFIEDALEKGNNIEIYGGNSAKESADLYASGMQTGEPLKGAFVFYDCFCQSDEGPVNWGHCGISLTDGKIIHAWDTIRIDNYRTIEELTAMGTGDHPRYLGWVPIRWIIENASSIGQNKIPQ